MTNSAIKELGKRLAGLLDEDDWNYIEPFLQNVEKQVDDLQFTIGVVKDAHKFKCDYIKQFNPMMEGLVTDYVLVPVKPSRRMLDAAKNNLVRDGEIDPMLKGVWKIMLNEATK